MVFEDVVIKGNEPWSKEKIFKQFIFTFLLSSFISSIGFKLRANQVEDIRRSRKIDRTINSIYESATRGRINLDIWWKLHSDLSNELVKRGHRIEIYQRYFSGSEMGVFALEFAENLGMAILPESWLD